MQAPQVGSIVHYYVSEEPRAAIVTEVRDDDTVSLVIFYPASISFASYAQYSKDRAAGTWCYLEDSATTILTER